LIRASAHTHLTQPKIITTINATSKYLINPAWAIWSSCWNFDAR